MQQSSLVAWRIVDPDAGRARINQPLPENSSLELIAGSDVVERLDRWGAMRGALQITHVFTHGEHGGPVHTNSEWIDPEKGTLVGAQTLASSVATDANGVQVIQHTTLLDSDAPTGLLAGLFWDQTLAVGDSGGLVLPPSGYNPTNIREPGRLEYKVTEMSEGRFGCEAHIRVEIDWPDSGDALVLDQFAGYVVELRLADGISLPTVFYATWTGGWRGSPLLVEMQEWSPGSGPTYPRYMQKGENGSGLPVSPVAARGLPRDENCYFGTCLGTAATRILMEPEVILWFQNHSDAHLRGVHHRSADPDSLYRDMWSMEWQDDTSLIQGIYTAFRVGPGGQVFISEEEPKDEVLKPMDSMVSIDHYGELHMKLFGGDPEYLSCLVDGGVCGVNTHYGSSTTPLGGQGPGLPRNLLGAQVGMETGRVYQLDTWDPSVMGPSPVY